MFLKQKVNNMKYSKKLRYRPLVLILIIILVVAAFNKDVFTSNKTTDFIYFNNHQIHFINPSIGTVTNKTSFEWRGNNPCNCERDTVISITHYEDLTEGTYSVKGSVNQNNNKEVKIRMNFGIFPDTTAAFYINIYDGDYTISKSNDKWISTLKNGIGYYTVDPFDLIEFKDIEFKATWPKEE